MLWDRSCRHCSRSLVVIRGVDEVGAESSVGGGDDHPIDVHVHMDG